MPEWVAWIPGDPVPKGSVRYRVVAPKGKRPFATPYPDPKSDRWEKDAAIVLSQTWRGQPLGIPVSLSFLFLLPRPRRLDCQHKRHPCSCPPEKLTGARQRHIQPPDLSNLIKAAEDAVVKAGIIEDDGQVWKFGPVAPSKVYARLGEETGVRVTLSWKVPRSP